MKYGTILLFLFLLFGFSTRSQAQFYVNGESPASIRWMQINTPQFQVVYPAGIQKEAELLIRELEKTAALSLDPYRMPAKKVPILLNTTSVNSNGFVTWAPRRMELIVTPPQDSYAQDWIGQLALHEYRHVVQISQLDQGFLAGLKYAMGEIAIGGGTATMPAWYYEGDAVLNETRLSAAGRGRSAGFDMPLRALLLGERKLYKFSKMKLGSYKDFVPNHYQYGYHMVNWANEHYGPDMWPDAMDYVSRNAFLLSPFSVYLIMKHKTSKIKLYSSSMDSTKGLYSKHENTITYTNYLKINQRKSRNYTSYRFPQQLENGDVLAMKSGIDQLNYFVRIDTAGKETKILTTGRISGLKSDLHGSLVLWDEIASDPRWPMRSFSEIRVFDLSKNKLHNLTRKTRYFSPAFSPDGQTIAVSETDLKNTHYITLISAKNGKLSGQFPSPGNREVTFPGWTSENKVIAITISATGKQIEQVDLSTGQWSVLLPYTRFDIQQPVRYRNYILFRSAYTGIENIFAFDLIRRKLYQVTFSRFGAYDPAVTSDSSGLLFSNYTDHGYDVVTIPLEESSWKGIPLSQEPAGIWPDAQTSPEFTENSLSDTVTSFHKAIPYGKLDHLVHVHSWLPFYVPIGGMPGSDNTLPVDLGVMFFAQNLLSTFISSVGYRYSEGNHYIAPKITWRGWYPVFEFSGQIGGPSQSYTYPEGIKPDIKPDVYYNYHVKTYVPLLFDRGKRITYFQPELDFERNSTHFFINGSEHSGINYLHSNLYASHYLRMSKRDLYPRLGGFVSASYTNTLGDEGHLGSMYSLQGGVYLPGIGKHHHLLLRGGRQKQDPGEYYLSINRIDFPRGYESAVSGEMNTFSADYALPLAYPDWSAEPIIYLKRIRADLFYDWSYGRNILEGKDKWYTGTYQSAGAELMVDFHAGRIIFPFSAGLRIGYLINTDKVFTEFLFRIQMQ